MKEINDFLLNLYTGSDRRRPTMMFPNLENGVVTATDARAVIMIPEDELCLNYETNPKFPNAQKIIDEFEALNLTKVKVKVSELAKELSKARLVIDRDSIDCKECQGRGCVEFEYKDRKGGHHYEDGDCPICDGEGHSLKDSDFARIRLEQRGDDNGNSYDIKVDDLYFHPFQIYRLFLIALTKNIDFIEFHYCKNDSFPRSVSYFGNIKVLTMLCPTPEIN